MKEDVAQLNIFFVIYFGYNILTFESVTEQKKTLKQIQFLRNKVTFPRNTHFII